MPSWPMAVLARNGSVSRRIQSDSHSKAVASMTRWSWWRPTCPPYPTTAATTTRLAQPAGEAQRGRFTQSAQAASAHRPP